MTILQAHHGDKVLTFETADDFPHVSEHNIGDSFHLFRITEKPATAKTACKLLEFAIVYCQDTDDTDYETDYPDIVGHNYEKQLHFGVKASCFEVDNYIIGATVLSPKEARKND